MKPNFTATFKTKILDHSLVSHLQYLTSDLFKFMTGSIDISNLPIQVSNKLVEIGQQYVSFSWQDSTKKREIIGVYPILTNEAILTNFSSKLINGGVSASFSSDKKCQITFMIIGK